MKKIYIVLSFTGTVLSRIIKFYTKNEFAHVSVALDEELEEMYSFGRLNPYNPILGGFVHEGVNRGTFKRFWRTRARLLSLDVTEKQYKKLQKTIVYFIENREKYKFNFIGLASVGINKRIVRKNTLYCAEFVRHVLKSAGITVINDLPKMIKPEDFKNLKGTEVEYEGPLRKYKR